MFQTLMFISLIALGNGFSAYISIVKQCNDDLKTLKQNPTVQTLYNTHYNYLDNKTLNKESLQDAIMNYKYLLNYCCRNEAVRERCLTEEQDNKFKEDLQREIKIFQDRNGMKVEVRNISLEDKQCDNDLKNLKENPTVLTLYNAETFWYLQDKTLSKDNLEDAIIKYRHLLDECCWDKYVSERCPTDEHEKKFLEDHQKQIQIFQDRNGEVVEVQTPEPTFKERCNLQLKQLKENPTVRTLYENADVFPLEKEGKLESYHLESAEYKYNYLIDECCPEEDPKEDTLMKKKFLEDLAQEIKNFKSENPAVELKMREPAERMCFGLEAYDIEPQHFQSVIAAIWRADNDLQEIALNIDSNIKPDDQKLFPDGSMANIKHKLTVKLLLTLFEIYDSHTTIKYDYLDTVSRKFIYHLVHTEPMKILRKYLKEYNVEYAADKKSFQDLLYDIWFRRYKKRNVLTSAFHHVFIGEEAQKNKVAGLHSWIRYFHLELNASTIYEHTIDQQTTGSTYVLTLKYRWGKNVKPKGSMLVGTSPEVHIAIFTLCYLLMPADACLFVISDCTQINVKTWPLESSEAQITESKSGWQQMLATAYPEVQNVKEDCLFDPRVVDHSPLDPSPKAQSLSPLE